MNPLKSMPEQTVYISFAEEDVRAADIIRSAIEKRGIQCESTSRLASDGSLSGLSKGAIGRSRVLIVIYSRHANESLTLQRELEFAASHEIFILPFRIKDAPMSKELEFYLSTFHWMDAVGVSQEESVSELVARVEQLMARRMRKDELPKERVPFSETAKRMIFETLSRVFSLLRSSLLRFLSLLYSFLRSSLLRFLPLQYSLFRHSILRSFLLCVPLISRNVPAAITFVSFFSTWFGVSFVSALFVVWLLDSYQTTEMVIGWFNGSFKTTMDRRALLLGTFLGFLAGVFSARSRYRSEVTNLATKQKEVTIREDTTND